MRPEQDTLKGVCGLPCLKLSDSLPSDSPSSISRRSLPPGEELVLVPGATSGEGDACILVFAKEGFPKCGAGPDAPSGQPSLMALVSPGGTSLTRVQNSLQGSHLGLRAGLPCRHSRWATCCYLPTSLSSWEFLPRAGPLPHTAQPRALSLKHYCTLPVGPMSSPRRGGSQTMSWVPPPSPPPWRTTCGLGHT